MEFLKTGEFDMQKQDQLLEKLRKAVGQFDIDKADELIKYFGLTGLQNKTAETSP
jgi:ubiquinone biosynthesis protein UbiJ